MELFLGPPPMCHPPALVPFAHCTGQTIDIPSTRQIRRPIKQHTNTPMHSPNMLDICIHQLVSQLEDQPKDFQGSGKARAYMCLGSKQCVSLRCETWRQGVRQAPNRRRVSSCEWTAVCIRGRKSARTCAQMRTMRFGHNACMQ